jgi:hypothetical protein
MYSTYTHEDPGFVRDKEVNDREIYYMSGF